MIRFHRRTRPPPDAETGWNCPAGPPPFPGRAAEAGDQLGVFDAVTPVL